jgi:hypothetical protein
MCLFSKDGRSNTLPHTSHGSKDFWDRRARLPVPSALVTNSCGFVGPISDLDKSRGLSGIVMGKLYMGQSKWIALQNAKYSVYKVIKIEYEKACGMWRCVLKESSTSEKAAVPALGITHSTE